MGTPTRVKDLMTRDVITLNIDENLDLAQFTMRTARIRHLPVVREDTVVGLITHRDLLRASITSLASLTESETAEVLRHVAVDLAMQKDFPRISEETLALEAGKRMMESDLSCLLVVDDEDTLLGIITDTDFFTLGLSMLEAETAVG